MKWVTLMDGPAKGRVLEYRNDETVPNHVRYQILREPPTVPLKPWTLPDNVTHDTVIYNIHRTSDPTSYLGYVEQ